MDQRIGFFVSHKHPLLFLQQRGNIGPCRKGVNAIRDISNPENAVLHANVLAIQGDIYAAKQDLKGHTA
jgi:hypothetical protein